MRAAESTVTSKGQVTVPRAFRDALGIRAGDRLRWTARPDGTIEVVRVHNRGLDQLVGLLGRPERSATLEEIDQAVREHFREQG